jgi:hypothetical protein
LQIPPGFAEPTARFGGVEVVRIQGESALCVLEPLVNEGLGLYRRPD